MHNISQLTSSNIDNNFYRTVNQRSHSSSLTSSSTSSSSAPMLGDVDEEKDNMTQIEMYRTFIGQSPVRHHDDSTHLIPNHDPHNTRKTRKKKKLKRYRNKKANEDSLFDRITSCFNKDNRRVIDKSNRTIKYNHNNT
eukprot:388116_1